MTVYVLRIVKPEWVDQVYSTGLYYGSIRRKFKKGDVILFFSKVEDTGDSLIGYGVVEGFYRRNNVPKDIAKEFYEHPWNWILRFSSLTRLPKPTPWKILVKEGVIPSWARGMYLHGYRLSDRQVDDLQSLIAGIAY